MEEENSHSPERLSRSRSVTVHPIESPPTHHSDDNSRLAQARQTIDLHDPHDPEARERQRTMDVDLAMQMSRARRGSTNIPVSGRQQAGGNSVFLPSSSPLRSSPEPGFPVLSPHEEEAMKSARSGGLGGEDVDHGVTANILHDADDHHDVSSTNPFNHNIPPQLSPSQEVDLLYSLNQGTRQELNTHDASSALPMYQPTAYRSNFDYSLMEEFGHEEKRRLGIGSSVRQRGLLPYSSTHGTREAPAAKAADTAALPIAFDPSKSAVEGLSSHPSDLEPSTEFTRLRQRKLSQSITTPGMRRGKSGKLALFEGNIAGATGVPPASFNQVAAGPSGWGIDPPGGMHGQGHDRPYRFSFYSNYLSATIHARSLSELPSEGQTFEELFTGKRRSESDEHSFPEGGVPVNVARLSRGILSPTSPMRNSRGDTPTAVSDSGLGPTLDKKSRMPDGAMDDDWEGNTWWLDVLDPTDDEMRMLSKARRCHFSCPSQSLTSHCVGIFYSPIDNRRHPDGGSTGEDRTVSQLLSCLFPFV